MLTAPTYSVGMDDFDLPDEGKIPEAQMYFNLIPVESRFKITALYFSNLT